MSEKLGKVAQPHRGFDIEAAHKIVALIEHKQGWQSEDNARYVVLENGDLAKKCDVKKVVKPSAKAADFEHATGEKSAQRIAQERGHKIIADANSWAELHQGLAEQGLRFEKKGSGAVVFVPSKNEPIAVKASSIDREFSMGKLRKKLGEYEDGQYAETITHKSAEPISPVNKNEWQEYQAETANKESNIEHTDKAEIWKVAQGDVAAELTSLDNLKKQQVLERQEITDLLKNEGFSVLNVGRHLLSQKHKQELAALRQINKQRKRLKSKPLRPRFEIWLRLRGLHKHADKWRHRRAFEKAESTTTPLQHNINELQNMNEAQLFQKYAQADHESFWADRYRVTCIKMDTNGDKKTFILDKRDGVTKGFTADEVVEKIPEMPSISSNIRQNISRDYLKYAF